MSGVVDAFGARRFGQVMQDTLGHLRADPATTYAGTILFARSEYGGDIIVIRSEGMPDSPWFYQGLLDWVCEQPMEPGGVYLWTGTYRSSPGDEHHFDGASTEVLPLSISDVSR